MSFPPPPPPAPPVSKSTIETNKKKKEGDGQDISGIIAKKITLIAEIIPVEVGPTPEYIEQYYDVNIVSVSTQSLYNSLQFGSQLLVIDTRSSEAFKLNHIRSAINVDWGKIHSEKKDGEVDLDGCDARLWHRRLFHVVIYDSGVSGVPDGGLAVQLAKALQSERKCKFDIAILERGYNDFVRKHPYLVTGTPQFSDAELPSEILENFLYLGSFNSASNRQTLRLLDITEIVNATDNCDMPFTSDTTLRYLHCPIDDDPKEDISVHFEPAITFLKEAEEARKKVLIHCKMGMSRSATLVILWLMVSRRISLKAATDQCRACRPFINPNPGFLQALGIFEESLLGSTTIRFPEGPVTIKTLYEWYDNGVWVPRVVVSEASDAAIASKTEQ